MGKKDVGRRTVGRRKPPQNRRGMPLACPQEKDNSAIIRDRLLKELDEIESHDSSKPFSIPAIQQSSNPAIFSNSPTFSTLRAHQQNFDQGLHVSGFQESAGIPDDAVAQAFEVSIPQSWKGIGAVTSIKAQASDQDDEDAMHPLTRLFQEENGAHVTVHLDSDFGDEIVPAILSSCARANDWNHASIISEEDRKKLFDVIAARIAAADRTPFERRGDALRRPQEDVDSYWRELASLALRIEAESEMHWEYLFGLILQSYRRASPRLDTFSGIASDIAAVRHAFALFDPDFEPWTAATERSRILRHAIRSSLCDLASASSHQLPEPVRLAFTPAIASIVGEETHLPSTTYHLPSLSGLPTNLAYAFHPVECALRAINDLSNVNGDLSPVHQHPALTDLDSAFGEIAFIASHHAPDLVEDFAKRIVFQD